MEYRLVPVLIALAIVAIGHILKRMSLHDFIKRRDFTIEFHNNLISLVNYFVRTGNFETEFYGKVANDLNAIQIELGADGIIAEMIDPIKGIKVRNYQIFMNIIHELREASIALDLFLRSGRVDQMVGGCDDSLRRHVGALTMVIDDWRKHLWNPFSCFGEGIRWIIILPGQMLVWLGIINPDRMKTAQENCVFKMIGNIVALIGFVSSIITILLGWQDTLDLVSKLFQR